MMASQRERAEEEADVRYKEWPSSKEEFPEWEYVPGRVDIQWACNKVYGNQEPFPQFTTMIKYWMGGGDPLDYCNCYLSKDGTHWHYITMGLTNLHRDPHIQNGPNGESGFGFELTFRLLREQGERVGPMWPFHVLQTLAIYVFRTGCSLLPGEVIPMDSIPERYCPGSTMQGWVTLSDPELEDFETERGSVRFVQLMAVAKEECQAAMQWTTRGMVELLCEGNALGVSDMTRGSIMDDEEIQQRVQRGREESGSNLGVFTIKVPIFFKPLSQEAPLRCHILLNQEAGQHLVETLPYRIPFGRFFHLSDTQDPVKEPDAAGFLSASLTVLPSEELKMETSELPNGGPVVLLHMTNEFCASFVRELQGLELREYRWEEFPELELEVIPTPSESNVVHDE